MLMLLFLCGVGSILQFFVSVVELVYARAHYALVDLNSAISIIRLLVLFSQSFWHFSETQHPAVLPQPGRYHRVKSTAAHH